MKKTLLILVIIFTSVLISSFKEKQEIESDEWVITITSVKQAKFDMLQDTTVVKGLTTPHEIKVKSSRSNFIFKSINPKANVKIEAKREGATITANWPITVLVINEGEISTFGMD